MNVVLALIFFSASAISAAMAAISMARSGRDAARITFGFAYIPIFLFSFFTAILYLQESQRAAILVFKLSTVGVFFYGPLILNLFLRLRGRDQKNWVFLVHLSISIFFFAWVAFSDDFILSVEYRSGMWIPVYWYAKPWMYLALGRFLFYTYNCAAQMRLWGMESKKRRVKFQSIFLGISCFLGDIWGIASILFLPMLNFFYQFPILFSMAWIVLRSDFLELNHKVNADAIIENIGDAVFILRSDLFIHFRNAAAKKIVSDEIEFFPSVMTDSKRFADELAELEAGRKKSAYLTIEFRDNHHGSAKLWLSAIRDNFGDVAGFLAICRENLGATQFRTRFGITAKEMEVIELVLEGMSNRQIAARLSLAVRTIETHIFKVYNRLNVKNRIELLSAAAQYDIHPQKSVETHSVTQAPYARQGQRPQVKAPRPFA